MEYLGELYGKIGNKYFDTGVSAKDFDKIEKQNKELLETLKEANTMIAVLKRSMLVHPDCEIGSEFCDYTTNAQNLEDEIEQLIKQATEL